MSNVCVYYTECVVIVCITVSVWCRVNLKMDVAVAARIVALRPALEALIVKATSDPESLSQADAVDVELTDVVRALSHINASQHYKLGDDTDAASSLQYVLYSRTKLYIVPDGVTRNVDISPYRHVEALNGQSASLYINTSH